MRNTASGRRSHASAGGDKRKGLPGAGSIRVMVAVENVLVRKGLMAMLDEITGITVDEGRSAWDETLAQISGSRYDLVMFHAEMHESVGGLQKLKDFVSLLPDTPVLVLDMHEEGAYAQRYMKAGAMGYLTLKDMDAGLSVAVSRMTRGERYLSPTVAERLAFARLDKLDVPLHERLSAREFEVMVKLSLGSGLSEIAAELNLSAKTISTYRARILGKLSLDNNSELTMYCLRHGIIPENLILRPTETQTRPPRLSIPESDLTGS